ncbi:MAG TPA: hypothetical protein VGS96_11250 [Thermoanaerobaculia bacterium]|nr:hypothetical protein [Thermoanaerobaculia bacterium]
MRVDFEKGDHTARPWDSPRRSFVQLRGFKMGIAELDELMESQTRAINSFPLKQVITSTTTSSRGGSRTWTTTTTISNVKESALPASEFDVPAGFTKTDMQHGAANR